MTKDRLAEAALKMGALEERCGHVKPFGVHGTEEVLQMTFKIVRRVPIRAIRALGS